jgi:ParB family chromosome partitioning protein
LTALFPQPGEKEAIIQLDVNLIKPNPHQPRRRVSQEGLAELAQSIKEKGIIQPLVVSEVDDQYQLISGERRWRAARLAGLDRVPAIVRAADELDQLELALVENLQREDLNPVEEAYAYQRLISEFGHTQEELARRLGKERSTLANRLRLLKLPESVQPDMAQGRITEGHARALLSLDGTDLLNRLRDEIISQGLSVREAEKRAKQLTRPKRTRQERDKLGGHLPFLEDELRRCLGTKVRISWQGKKGKVEIEYYSQEELDRIIEVTPKQSGKCRPGGGN